MPQPERKLWFYIRRKQLGVKFRRQHSIERYIVDFFCCELKLAIELDGNKAIKTDEVYKEIHSLKKSFNLKKIQLKN